MNTRVVTSSQVLGGKGHKIKCCRLNESNSGFSFMLKQNILTDILPVGCLHRKAKGRRNGITPSSDPWKSKFSPQPRRPSQFWNDPFACFGEACNC